MHTGCNSDTYINMWCSEDTLEERWVLHIYNIWVNAIFSLLWKNSLLKLRPDRWYIKSMNIKSAIMGVEYTLVEGNNDI